MQIDQAQIRTGPDSGREILALLQRYLNPNDAAFEAAMRKVAARVDRDAGRLPWTAAVLAWLDSQGTGGVQQTLAA